MKPRGKRMQRQNGRMYLRKCDHRDVIIMDSDTGKDVYHNIIYYVESEKDSNGNPKKDKDGNTITKSYLAWQKYPEKLINFGIQCGGSSGYSSKNYSAWLDVERHMIYTMGTRAYAGITQQVLRSKNYILEMDTYHYWSTEYTSFSGSTDSMVYHSDENSTSIPYDLATASNKSRIDDTIIHTYNGSSYPYSKLYMDKIEFKIDEETEKFTSKYTELPTIIFEKSVGDQYIIGRTDDEVILARGLMTWDPDNPYYLPGSNPDFTDIKHKRYYWSFYEIGSTGATKYLCDTINTPTKIVDVNDFGTFFLTSGTYHANQLYFMIHRMTGKKKGIDSETGALIDVYTHKLHIIRGVPGRDPYDTQITLEISKITKSSNNPFTACAFVSRGSGLYAYYYDNEDKRVSLWKKRNGNWFQMNLTSYKDIPISTTGGWMVDAYPTAQVLRVHFDTTPAPSNTNIDLSDFGDFMDSEDLDMSDPTIIDVNFWDFISNGRFDHSTFFDRGEIQENDMADYGIILCKTIDDNSAIFLYSHNLDFTPSEHTWAAICKYDSNGNPVYDYVIEGDYMYTDYTKTDGESSFGNDMYIWHNADSEKGISEGYEVLNQGSSDWSEYADYEMRSVTELPEKGSEGIIYIVPRKYPASETCKYVWNSKKKRFESLQTTTVDLNQTFRELKVPYLPKVGESGIIYILPTENQNVTPEEEAEIDPQTSFTQYVYVDGMFMSPEAAGLSLVDLTKYSVTYVMTLPDEGEANKLYLVPNVNINLEEG